MKAEPIRYEQEKQDELDIEIIQYIFFQKKERVGALQIKMILENDYCIYMNHKKIRRLMRKYKLFTKVRRANPYRKMAKANQEHRTCPNLLERNFKQNKPKKVLLTDITYMYYTNGQRAYLSCVKDGSTGEILSHYLSTSINMNIAYKTIDKLKKTCNTFDVDTILHSDQGVHYTHPEFQKVIKELGIQQSMSRRGNCWDNAPMESFFGHLKDEIDYKECKTFSELKAMVDSYMEEYNNSRYQWGLKKMTPVQYRNHLLAA